MNTSNSKTIERLIRRRRLKLAGALALLAGSLVALAAMGLLMYTDTPAEQPPGKIGEEPMVPYSAN